MREQWDKWAWAVALVVIALVVLRAAWGREAFCGSESEQCFREWVSALGGWAAVAAAVPTVVYLSRQVSDAERNSREERWNERRKTLALARRVLSAIVEVNAFTGNYEEEINEPEASYGPSMVIFLENLRRVMQQKLFESAEIEVAPTFGINAALIANMASDFEHGLRQSIASGFRIPAVSVEDYLEGVKTVIEAWRDYAEQMEQNCQSFIDDTQGLLGSA